MKKFPMNLESWFSKRRYSHARSPTSGDVHLPFLRLVKNHRTEKRRITSWRRIQQMPTMWICSAKYWQGVSSCWIIFRNIANFSLIRSSTLLPLVAVIHPFGLSHFVNCRLTRRSRGTLRDKTAQRP